MASRLSATKTIRMSTGVFLRAGSPAVWCIVEMNLMFSFALYRGRRAARIATDLFRRRWPAWLGRVRPLGVVGGHSAEGDESGG